ncbi:MAG: VCBS repeat-containing protein [Kofleriaceae bacterium]|nr:VCBS repeat-containing protein [Kofleriaceae bacterium]
MRRLPGTLLCLSLWGLSGAACSNLDEIRPNICGNLALDTNEDCDGSSRFDNDAIDAPQTACGKPNTENGCFYIHDFGGEIDCPSGWAAGDDGRCRLPSGEFTPDPDAPYRFPVDNFAVGDVDGDGFADLIGNSSTTITVRYGSSDGSFVDELEVFTREATGPLAYQDLDGDSLLDVIVPIPGGMYTLLGTGNRDLEPVAYSSFPIENGDKPLRLISLPSDEALNVVTPVVVFGAGSNGYLLTFPEQTKQPPLPVDQGADMLAGRIPVGLLTPPPPFGNNLPDALLQRGRHSFALAFLGDTEINIYTTSGEVFDGSLRIILQQTVALPPNTRPGPGGAHFADVNGDDNLDLVVSAIKQSGTGREDISIALNQGNGTLTTLSLAPIRIYKETGAVDTWNKVPFPLAMADVSGDGIADYITLRGIYTTNIGSVPAGLGVVFRTGTTPTGSDWNNATIADLNSDGALDVVTTTDDENSLSVYIGHGSGLFNKFTVPTEVPPSMLRSGDFDGDLIADIAFVEVDENDDEADRISVAFGSRTGSISTPIFMGTLGHIEVLEPAVIPSARGVDAIPDLLVVSRFTTFDMVGDLTETRSTAFLEGDTARRMVSPFVLPKTENDDGFDSPVQIVVGSFVGENDDIPDVLIVTVEQLDDEVEGEREHRLFTLRGTGGGQFAITGSGTTGNGEDESSDSIIQAEGFNAACALWTVGDLHKHSSKAADLEADPNLDGTDELIGFDGLVGPGICSNEHSELQNVVVSSTSDDVQPLELLSEASQATTLKSISDIELFDADLDGDQDVVVVYRGLVDNMSLDENYASEGDGVVVYWNQDGSFPGSSLLDGSDLQMRSAAPILLLGDDAIPELLVLGKDGLFISTLTPDNKEFSSLEPLPNFIPDFEYESFEVGDFNGDGLTDLALIFGSQVDILLSVPKEPLGTRLAAAAAREDDTLTDLEEVGQ